MKFQERYQFDFAKDLLGTGGFASVYKAKDVLLDRDVAIKIFSQQSGNKYSVVEEIKKVIKFEHPSLLRYNDVVLLDQQNVLGQKEQLQIGVMEYANAGDLKDFAKANPNSPLLFKFLQQVLKGLEYLHQKNIVHRDLKPQNILLVEENGQINAKLSDFGISKDMESEAKSSTMAVGTIEYMAPEQFSPQKYGIDGKIGSNVDLWSFGIMVHELITQTTPFGSRDGNTTAEQIMSSILSTEQPKDFDKLPEPYRTVVKKCLVANAKERIRKASELIQYFDSNYSQSNSTANDNQTTQEQATKVYGKTSDPNNNNTQNSSSKNNNQEDDKTKVYGKQDQNQNTNDDATKVYPKGKEDNPAVQSKHKTKKVTAFVVLLFLGILVSVFYNLNEQNKAEKLARLQAEEVTKLAEMKLQEEQQARQKVEDEARQRAETEAKQKAEQEAKQKQAEDKDRKKQGEKKNNNQLSESNKITEAITNPKAIEWFKEAEQNNADAQFEVGQLYLEGCCGVKQDYKKAMEWYLKAAEQNHIMAQARVGSLYLLGKGVTRDYKKAMEWSLKSAEQGYSYPQYDVGKMYLEGRGVPKDVNKALYWFQKSAEQNNGDAKEALKQLQ